MQYQDRNRFAAGAFITMCAFAIGWLAALGFANDVFDLDPPIERVAYVSNLGDRR